MLAAALHVCPHRDWASRGWLGLGNIRANGHPRGGPWRQFPGTSCTGYVLETPGTLFHGQQASVERRVPGFACLAEGVGLRATARGFAVDANTGLQWLGEAAEQRRAFSASLLCALHLEQGPLEAWSAGLRARNAGALKADAALRRLERAPDWGWTALDPTSQVLGVVEVGCRTLARAQRVVPQGTRGLAPGGVPRFLTDGLKDEGTALLTQLGVWRQPERRQDKGPRPTPRGRPRPVRL